MKVEDTIKPADYILFYFTINKNQHELIQGTCIFRENISYSQTVKKKKTSVTLKQKILTLVGWWTNISRLYRQRRLNYPTKKLSCEKVLQQWQSAVISMQNMKYVPTYNLLI